MMVRLVARSPNLTRTVSVCAGSKVPAIAYGTGSLGKGDSTVFYVDEALDAGFLHIGAFISVSTNGLC